MAVGECPVGCYCDDEGERIDCFNLSLFPTGIPATINSITIMNSDIPDIPTDAFGNLPNLTSVTFMEVTIETIRHRAFYRIGRGVPNKSMIFVWCNISKIESGAFEELEDFSEISLNMVNIFDGGSAAFNKVKNVDSFAMYKLSMPVIRSGMFTDFTNVKNVFLANSAFDRIENEAFSNFSNISSLLLSQSAVGTLGNRFLVLTDARQVLFAECAFESWKNCAFCGISGTTVVQLYKNVIQSSEGDVLSGMIGVETLIIHMNTIPLLVARFFPLDLKTLTFFRNSVTTIMCQPPDIDYPSTITYAFFWNYISCDCRLNWMWMNWSQTKAALKLSGGFVCSKYHAGHTSLSDFFAKSVAGIAAPCDGLDPVNGCVASTVKISTISSTTATPSNSSTTAAPSNSSTTAAPSNPFTTAAPSNSSTTATPSNSSTTAAPSITSTTAAPSITSTTAGPNDESSAVKSQASWMCSIAIGMFIVIAAYDTLE